MNAHAKGCSCGACQPPGGELLTPNNRPSLPSVAYRRGTFSAFRRVLLERAALEPALARLSTHGSDDHSVATLELWAVVADVLGFYSERYLNEAYLGTAGDLRSVTRMARLVGYKPRPGVAALSWLAFTLEPGITAALPSGIAVQSKPVPSADGPPPPPVTFETLEPLVASATWNANRAFLTNGPSLPALSAGQLRTVFRRDDAPAAATAVRPNDTVLLWNDSGIEEKLVREVVIERERAIIEWGNPIRAANGAFVHAQKLVRSLGVFGAGAPGHWMEPATTTAPAGIVWNLRETPFSVAGGATSLELAGKVDDIEPGTRLLVHAGPMPFVYTATAVSAGNATVGPVSDAVTVVALDGPLPQYDRRMVRVYVLSGPELRFWGGDYAERAPTADVYLPVFRTVLQDGRTGVEVGRRIEGGAWVPGSTLDLDEVDVDRAFIVAWDGPQLASSPQPAVARLSRRPVLPAFDAAGFGHVRLELTFIEPPDATWAPSRSVTLLGNVVQASHGETVHEVLGNGDATRAFQHFTLGRKPLTFVPARVPGGAASTLVVSDDNMIRPEVPSLYLRAGTDPVVETSLRPDGSTEISGGDGKTKGARFTTGAGNVRARYRIGVGLAGRVPAGRLTTLLSQPPGVRSVVNPRAAEGGAEAESMAQARENAPASVRTLGRAVSLRDLEDLALSTGQVAKAQAVWVWDGTDRSIHVTVAAPGGASLSNSLRQTITVGLDSARDATRRLTVEDRRLVPVTLVANVIISRSTDRPDQVLAACDRVARAALSFEAVRLGQPLAVSDLIAALASVPQVVGVDVDSFGYAASAGFDAAELDARGVAFLPDGRPAPLQPRVRFFPARAGATRGSFRPAELPEVRTPTDVRVIDGGRA